MNLETTTNSSADMDLMKMRTWMRYGRASHRNVLQVSLCFSWSRVGNPTLYHFVFERGTEDVHGDYSNGLGKKMEGTSSKETYQHLRLHMQSELGLNGTWFSHSTICLPGDTACRGPFMHNYFPCFRVTIAIDMHGWRFGGWSPYPHWWTFSK